MRKVALPEEVLIDVFGHHDENLRAIEKDVGVRVSARGTEVTVQGDPEKEALAANLIEQLVTVVRGGYALKRGDVEIAARLLRDNRQAVLHEFFAAGRLRATNGRYVTPKSINQRLYLDAIRDSDLVFSIGPAGTGKTYLAVAAAVSHLSEKKVDRIILCRPAVEAGEKLGFLPGDMAEKVDPYFRPLYDALYHLLDRERANSQLERGAIEIAPLGGGQRRPQAARDRQSGPPGPAALGGTGRAGVTQPHAGNLVRKARRSQRSSQGTPGDAAGPSPRCGGAALRVESALDPSVLP